MNFTLNRLRRHWPRVLLFVVFSTLGVLFTIATALSVADFLKLLFRDSSLGGLPNMTSGNLVTQGLEWLYNYLIAYGERKALLFFSLFVLCTYTLKNVFCYLAAVVVAKLNYKIIEGIRNDMFFRMLRFPVGYFVTHRKGDILSRFSGDMIEYEENVLNAMQSLVTSLVNMICYLLMLVYINARLTLFVLCMLPFVVFVISGITRRLRRKSVELQERNSRLMSMMEETLMGLKIIKAYTAIDFSNRQFREQDKAFTRLRVAVFRRIYLASPISDFLGNVIVVGILLFGTMLVVHGDHGLTPELFISYIALFVLMIPPAKALTTAISNIKKGRGCEDRLQSLLDEQEEGAADVGANFEGLQSSIDFRHVSFRYDTHDSVMSADTVARQWVLDDINLTISKGLQVALVGGSGSGKSTLADLISRFYDISRGELLIDGRPIGEYSLQSLRSHIGVVAQDTMLFNDTVAANIAYGHPDATREEIIAAARVANAHDFIMQLPEGYDTPIGDRGEMLSGGQRQRISIARTVLGHPDILILDEATSALDTESERAVQQALDQVLHGRTALIIAHRLSTISHVDLIVVLEGGRIVEKGTHRELIARRGRYYELVQLQRMEHVGDTEQ